MTKPEVQPEELSQALRQRGFSEEKINSLTTWATRMSQIEIGARALYNVALYVALGVKCAELNTPDSSAIMLPLGVDDTVWERDAMNHGYRWARKNLKPRETFIPGSYHIPMVYSREDLRQPFGF